MLKILTLTAFFMGLIWILVVPVWHFPDEQIHFSQVAFVAVHGRNPTNLDLLDVTQEIFVSEQLLGTYRDELGNNMFTHRPGYRMDFTESYEGKYEASIAALARTDAQTTFVRREASRYPFLYYAPASLFYRAFASTDIFVRVIVVRLWSLGLFLLTLLTVYKIGSLLFRNTFLAGSLAALVGLQPMMVFANVGVNSDALGNLVFIVFTYVCARLVVYGMRLPYVIHLFLIDIICLYTKPQFMIVIPITILLLLFIAVRDAAKKYIPIILMGLLLGGGVVVWGMQRSDFGSIALLGDFLRSGNISSFLTFSREYTLSHTYREVMPWFWGVYNWLGVTYPRWVHRLINRIVLTALIGFGIWLIYTFYTKRYVHRRTQAVLILMGIGIIFFWSISIYDWYLWYTTSFALGVQGRYFFPIVPSLMAAVLIGWRTLFPHAILKYYMTLAIVFAMVVFNFYGLYTVTSAYYSFNSVQELLWQASQYKPFFAKNYYLIAAFTLYILTLGYFLYELLRLSLPKKT